LEKPTTYLFSQKMQVEAWILIFLSAGMAILCSIIISRRLVRPIRLLIQKAGRLAQGHFDDPLPVTRGDEIGNLTRSFNQMSEKLKAARNSEKLAAIGKAAAAIAHELKNSLTMTYTYIGLLPAKRGDARFVNKLTQVVPQELDNWKSMLQDLSDFSRQAKFEMDIVNVKALIEDFILLIGERLTQKKISLEVHVPDELPRVTGNMQKLKQMLMNIVLNAIEAMPNGGKIMLVAEHSQGRRSIGAESGHLKIVIKDSGRGISSDRLNGIFDAFETTKRNGLGLGLSISREIAERCP